jgi:hypothetical protein
MGDSSRVIEENALMAKLSARTHTHTHIFSRMHHFHLG